MQLFCSLLCVYTIIEFAQDTFLTSTSTTASSDSEFVLVDPALAAALVQDKKDKKQLLLTKTMADARP